MSAKKAPAVTKAKVMPMRMPMHFMHHGGKADPLYRTWWYFIKAVSKDGSIDTALQSQVDHVQLIFGDGEDMYMDRMPRRSARKPIVKFICSQPYSPNFAQEKTEELDGVGYSLEITPPAAPKKPEGAAAASTDDNDDDFTPPWGPAAAKNCSGFLTFDPANPVPKNDMYGRNRGGPKNTAAGGKPSEKAKAIQAREQKLKDIVTTVDAAGSTTAKCKVAFAVTRSQQANTLELTHPLNGTVYHFSTTDPHPYEPASAAGSAAGVPAAPVLLKKASYKKVPQSPSQAQQQQQQQQAPQPPPQQVQVQVQQQQQQKPVQSQQQQPKPKV